MTANLEIHKSIDTLDPSVWDHLSGGQIYAQRDWLRAVREGIRHGDMAHYILYRHGSRPAAAAVAYDLSATGGPTRFDELFFGRLAATAHRLRLTPPRVLFVGPLIGHGSNILCPNEASQRTAPVLESFIRELIAYAESLGALMVVPRLPEMERNLTLALRRSGFNETESWPISILNLPPRDFDDYVSGLSAVAKNQANKTRRELAAPAKMGVNIEYQRPRDCDHAALELLLAEHEGKYHRGEPQILRGFLAKLSQYDEGNCVLITAHHGGELLGFSVLATAESRASGPLIAVPDIPINRKAFTYFNLAFYGPIRFCLENGLGRLDIGGGMAAMKKRRGFQQETVRTFVSPRGLLDSARWSLLLRAHEYNVKRKAPQTN